MATQTFPYHHVEPRSGMAAARRDLTRWLVPIGRVFFALIFLLTVFGHFSRETIEYAAQRGVPAANVLVPLSGLMGLVGGLMVLVGWQARIGATILVAMLVPITLMIHNFWAFDDPGARRLQQVMFMKNLSIIGAAIILVHFGAGPISIDAWRARKLAAQPVT
jgi:putative oxidoreductase